MDTADKKSVREEEITCSIKKMLDIFDKVGIAPRERFNEAPEKYHPKNLLEDFQSVIVFAQGSAGADMGSFSDYLGTIAAQSDVASYLKSLGYGNKIIEGTTRDVSLVRMGVEAGVGGLSPVNSLVVEKLGLTASLGAIITNAPLVPDEKMTEVCVGCMECLDACPIRDTPNSEGDLSKCGCGKCVNVCPV